MTGKEMNCVCINQKKWEMISSKSQAIKPLVVLAIPLK